MKVFVLNLVDEVDGIPFLAHCSVHKTQESLERKETEIIEKARKTGKEILPLDFFITECQV